VERAALLILAFMLDALIGDPPWLPHPVRFIGKVIATSEQWLRPESASPGGNFWCGLGLVMGVVSSTYLGAALLLHTLAALSWWLEQGSSILLGALCLARRSLKEHARAVLLPLSTGDMETARALLACIVSRETTDLPENEIIRGTVESVAENSSDGVIAPLFYLALGGVPLALTYKAVNTLDSMLGYHSARYEYFGKAAARLDDLVNFIPARLAALMLIVAAWIRSLFAHSYDGAGAWRSAWRDGHKHPSPNAGYPEAAVAGALGVQLGGPSRYLGTVVKKPTLGEARQRLRLAHISQSLVLLDTASALTLLSCVIIRLLVS